MLTLAESTGLSPFQVLALCIVACMLVLAMAIVAHDAKRAAEEAVREAEDDELSRYEPTPTGPLANPDHQRR